jgi:hypothetical protein
MIVLKRFQFVKIYLLCSSLLERSRIQLQAYKYMPRATETTQKHIWQVSSEKGGLKILFGREAGLLCAMKV